MIPTNVTYPEFVPDQLLTSDNLNELFGYLDEQGRITRTNLLGIGIVCGFEVMTAADGTSIKITKGTGITSEGYLVSQEEATYTQRINFEPAQEVFYDKFLNAAHTKKFDLWELKQAAAVPGAAPLTLPFLNGGGNNNDQKVVLLFVELFQELNKNCNPESCDDLGITINVNLRPLLVRKQDAAAFNLTAGIGDIYYNKNFATMAELRMPRFDVVASEVVSAAGLFSAYKKILHPKFLQSVETLLTSAWTQFSPVVGPEYGNVNPFGSLAEKFAFLNDGSIVAGQIRNIQYIYDHFSDLLAAYEEFRRTGMEVLGTCCPDSGLFPRHLLLDLAIHDKNQLHSAFRHYFRYSPLFERHDLYARLRSLFRRLVLMITQFQVPAVTGAADNPDGHIRITPSLLDTSPLSSKAIPFYYTPTAPAADPLFKHWSYEKTQATDADQNLSYNAGAYSSKGFVVSPLKYDLEPYNFLRIEGHVGKPYSHVLSNLKSRIKENRLPIDVIALSLGTNAAETEIVDPAVIKQVQTLYEVVRTEVLCCLKRQLAYWGTLEIKDFSHYGHLSVSDAVLTQGVFGLGTVAGALALAVNQPTKAPASKASTASGTSSGGETAAMLSKGEHLSAILGVMPERSVGNEYLRYQAQGDFNLSKIPAPATAVLDTPSISHFALIIVDEMEEIIQLLEAENPLAMNVEAMETHRATLEKALATLTKLVTKELDARKPFMKVKAYVGEAQSTRVDAIAAAMPDLGDQNVNTAVLLLLNLAESEKVSMVNQLQAQKGNRNSQQSILDVFFERIDKDGMQIPSNKDVTVVDDPFLQEMRERLKGFNCLCDLEAFKKLRAVMQALIDELKGANLFRNFSDKHPGIQHKAGVTMGGTFIVVYHRTGEATPDNPDEVYKAVSGDLADRIVVADFYLPYLSYSSAPPIVYQVVDAEPVPEEVTLELQPNPKTGALIFSVGDETPYKFTHVPDNGTLINGTAGNGVTSPAADDFVFTPNKTQALLGNNPKVDLIFTYLKKGVPSDPVNVTVFNVPKAIIKPEPNTPDLPLNSTVNLVADIVFADKFRWIVKDPTGASVEAGTSQNLANFPLTKEGTYAFTLQVTQSETAVVAFSNAVEIKVAKAEEIPAPKKTCSSLASVVDGYKKLPEGIDRQLFLTFNSQILKELGIDEYFQMLPEIVVLDEGDQLAFFMKPLRNQGSLAENIAAWQDRLALMILDERQAALRPLALETYRLLTSLTLYVQCIKKDDLDKFEAQIFANMILHLKGRGTAPGILSLKLTAAEADVLKRFSEDIKAELERLTINNAIQPKPKYDEALKAVAATISGGRTVTVLGGRIGTTPAPRAITAPKRRSTDTVTAPKPKKVSPRSPRRKGPK